MSNKLFELTSAAIELKALLKNQELKDYQRKAYETALKLVDRAISEEIIDNC